MAASERERKERLAAIGRVLRSTVNVPTDTYITGDIPLLLTRLAQVPAVDVTADRQRSAHRPR